MFVDEQKDEIDWNLIWKPDIEVLNSLDLQEDFTIELMVCFPFTQLTIRITQPE